MKRIVLPGFGSATTFTVVEDTELTVMANGKLIPLVLRPGTTRVEFLGSIGTTALAA
jgi:hypothetical protein